MRFWEEPKPLPAEKMPARGERRPPSRGGRVLAALAGLALGTSAALGLWHAAHQAAGRGSLLGSLALLAPAALLLRYALTGKIQSRSR
ncbi:MAG: hypothetical protein HY744_07245 [Deltaproteobacteria bacterium]|nr:hypothetical protein [Deltaproteobacteria bacterium]